MLRWDWKYISMYFMKYLGFIVNELKHEKKKITVIFLLKCTCKV